MSNDATVAGRQLWGAFPATTTGTETTKYWCTRLILPTGGVIVFDENFTTTIHGAKATFKIPCADEQTIISPDTTGNSSVIGFSEPFYSSISPQSYALATATVISYILVILIFITPRTFYMGGPGGGGSGSLSRSGLVSGYGGANSIMSIGRRPLLQKIATITVAISLTIASADTFRVAKEQYYQGYIDSGILVNHVVGSLEVRIVRVISDTFLWLAQVQTLIRLFPRHKEKVAIKWLGFALVTFDTIFSIIDSFVSSDDSYWPRRYSDAIPALNYLFELAISLIYASCVVYYSLSKRRFAFWHPKMRNICLVALISYMAILIPVVFFVLDISLPNVAGWGEYMRWVGAAAASVVVWEWVERIEALERDERKDGILGREIFDGDEMLDLTPSNDSAWSHGGSGTASGRDVEKGPSSGFVRGLAKARAKMPLKRRKRRAADSTELSGSAAIASGASIQPQTISVPNNSITPPSRSDTASAASTVYAVRYHNLTSPSPAIAEQPEEHMPPAEAHVAQTSIEGSTEPATPEKEAIPERKANMQIAEAPSQARQLWQSVANPFKRRRAEPPAEVAGAQLASGMRRSPIDRAINLKDRIGAWGTAQRDRFGRNACVNHEELPVMVIPAPKADQRTWSPDEVRASTTITEQRQEEVDHAQVEAACQQPLSLTVDHDVVFIPAPVNGRMWSPQDLREPNGSSSSHSAQCQSTSTPSDRAATTTLRGALTIEENPRASGNASARRSTYVRPTSISPIAQSMRAGPGGCFPSTGSPLSAVGPSAPPPPEAISTPGPEAPSAPTIEEIEEGASEQRQSPAAPAAPSQKQSQPTNQPTHSSSPVDSSKTAEERKGIGDGRDTGGT